MSETVERSITMAVGIALTCALITIAIYLMNTGKGLLTTFGSRINTINVDISESDLTKYSGVQVKGSDVVNCIRRYKDDLEIIVYKNVGSDGSTVINTTYNASSGEFKNLPAQADDDFVIVPPNTVYNADGQMYINPNATFLGKVVRNSNGLVTRVEFSQVGFVLDALDVPIGNTTIIVNEGKGSETASIEDSLQAITDTFEVFNQKIDDFINNGGNSDGTDLVSTVEALLYQMSNEGGILDQILKEIEGVRSSGLDSTGTDINTQIDSLRAEIRSLAAVIESNISGAQSEHTADDLYKQLEQVAVLFGTFTEQMNSITDGLASDQKTLTDMLQEIKEEQANQGDQLDRIEDGVNSANDKLDNINGKLDTADNESESMNYTAVYNAVSDISGNMYKTKENLERLIKWINENEGGDIYVIP